MFLRRCVISTVLISLLGLLMMTKKLLRSVEDVNHGQKEVPVRKVKERFGSNLRIPLDKGDFLCYTNCITLHGTVSTHNTVCHTQEVMLFVHIGL